MADKYEWTDKRTGRKYVGDEFGNEINKSGPDKGKPAGISAPKLEDKFYNLFGRHVAPALTSVGGIAGMMASPYLTLPSGGAINPISGGAAGTAVGSSIGKMLQTLAPSYFGEYAPQNVMEPIKDVTGDVALDVGTSVAGKALGLGFPSSRKALFERMIQRHFPNTDLTPDQLDALKRNPQFPVSVGQVNSTADWLETTFSPRNRKQLEQKQLSIIHNKLTKDLKPPEIVVGTAADNATDLANKMKDKVQTAYKAFEPMIEKNVREVEVIEPIKNKTILGYSTLQPTSRFEKVKGPIDLVESKAFAEKVGTELDDIFRRTPLESSGLSKGTAQSLSKLKENLDYIRNVRGGVNPATGVNQQNPVLSYAKVKAMRDEINLFLNNTDDEVLKTRLTGGMRALASTLRNDIKTSVGSWKKVGGRNPLHVLEQADKLNKERALKLDNKMANDLINRGYDGNETLSAIGQRALSDPELMKRFVMATGDRPSASNLFMNDVVESAYDNAAQQFDPNIALNKMFKNRHVAEVAVPSGTRTNAERFLRLAQIAKPFQEKSNTGLKLWAARGMIGLATTGASFAATGNLSAAPAAAAGMILLTPTIGRSFVKNVLMNEKNARIAAGLLKASPESKTARIGTKALAATMKGMTAIYRTPEGREIPVQIQENGSVRPISLDEAGEEVQKMIQQNSQSQ